MNAQVIIVGGGPVGLSLALGLAHHGVRSITLEREPEPTMESRALVIWPRSLEVLADWGAFEPLRAAGTWRSKFEMWYAQTGEPLLQADFSTLSDVLAWTGALLLPQSDTERVFRQLVAANALCELQAGYEATALEQDSDGVIVTADGPSGSEQFRAPYAVGCDGAHGIVRHALGMTLEGATYRARAVLSDVTATGTPWTPPSPRVSFMNGTFTLGIEYAPSRWRIVSLVPEGASDEQALDSQALALRLERLFGEKRPWTVTWSSLFRIHRRHAQCFFEARVAIAGDAAHLNSPAGGQGMNAGIQDAANLAWKLAYALDRRCDAPTLLESYNQERHEMIMGNVERFTDSITRYGMPAIRRFGPLPLRLVRRWLRGPGMQRKLCRAIGMLGGRYTKSPVIDSRHPLAGRRVDDLILADGVRINQRRGGKAALLAVGALATATIPPLGANVLQIDAAPRHWLVKPPTVLVIRPDGCVAAVVEKPTKERVTAAWQKAFALSTR